MPTKRVKRVELTLRELNLIIEMCCIASAAEWGEGDYIGEFNKKQAPQVFNSLRSKVFELIAQQKGATR